MLLTLTKPWRYYAVDSQTLNYAPVAVGIVFVWVLASWFLWARKWFHGPRRSESNFSPTDCEAWQG